MCPILTIRHIVDPLQRTFKIYPIFNSWVHCGQVLSVPTMYSHCTHWIYGSLSPVLLPLPILEWLIWPLSTVLTPTLSTLHWAVPGRSMSITRCVIFSCINPVRQFKRRMVYDKTNPNTFPEYNLSPKWDEDVMESDKEATLQLYNLKVPCMYFPIKHFVYWEAGELLPV